MPDALPPPDAPARPASRRAEAWVHAVLNPLIDTLPTEIALLERGNITFSCDTKGLRYMRRIEGTLTAPARHVLRDFLRANHDAEEPVRTHDVAVERLTIAARTAYETLSESETFRDAIQALLARAEQATPPAPAGAAQPRVQIDPEQLVRALAEFVVNRRGEVSDCESTFATIWDRERDRLLAYRVGGAFARCDEATTVLCEAARRLHRWLQDKSFALCERYDIAAAPLGERR